MALGVAVGMYGLSFGAAASAAGLSVLQACAMSSLIFTGASQFALVGVLGAGGSAAAGVATALLLGTRNAMYAVILAERIPMSPQRKLLAAQVTIDESTAVSVTSSKPLAGVGFWSAGLTVYVMWNLMTLAGAAGAASVDTHALGLDAAVGAAFLGLLWPRLREAWPVALGGALLALIAVPLTPAGVPVLIAALAVLPRLVRR
ncbi:MAG: branched-chain amino acid transporter permease [Frankiales bacterium]|nr:branched-chain amino acid transporter permease [Frankiales bacterium]